MVSHFI